MSGFVRHGDPPVAAFLDERAKTLPRTRGANLPVPAKNVWVAPSARFKSGSEIRSLFWPSGTPPRNVCFLALCRCRLLARYCCKSPLGYETQDIESWAAFTWQGRSKAERVPERTLRRGSFPPTFATLSARTRRHQERRGVRFQRESGHDADRLSLPSLTPKRTWRNVR